MKIIIWFLVWMMHLGVTGVKAENLSTLLESYVIIENELALYEQELEILTQKEDVSLTDYKELATKTWKLKEVLEELDEQLQILYTQAKDNQVSFQITAHLENYDGPEPDRTLANGEILAFQATVPTYGSKDSPSIGYLIWQLYDGQDQPIQGVQKVRQINENGELEQARFRFQINNLPNGTYTVALLHQLEGGDNTKTALHQFTVEEPISINRLVVSNNTEATNHQSVLSSEDIPYGFVYFTLSESVSEATILLQMINQNSGQIIANQEVVRERAINGEEQRVGIRVDVGTTTIDTPYVFSVTLKQNNDVIKKAEVLFQIQQPQYAKKENVIEEKKISIDYSIDKDQLHQCVCYTYGLMEGSYRRHSDDEYGWSRDNEVIQSLKKIACDFYPPRSKLSSKALRDGVEQGYNNPTFEARSDEYGWVGNLSTNPNFEEYCPKPLIEKVIDSKWSECDGEEHEYFDQVLYQEFGYLEGDNSGEFFSYLYGDYPPVGCDQKTDQYDFDDWEINHIGYSCQYYCEQDYYFFTNTDFPLKLFYWDKGRFIEAPYFYDREVSIYRSR